MRKTVISIFVLLFFCYNLYGQSKDYNERSRTLLYQEPINATQFDEDLFKDALLFEINNELSVHHKVELIPLELLSLSAASYADFMVSSDIIKVDQGGSGLSLQSRLEANGGAYNNAIELVAKNAIFKGKDPMTFQEVAKEITFAWFNNAKSAEILKHDRYIFVGISGKLSSDQKKIYVSLVMGNYKTKNDGASRINSLYKPITTSTMKLLPYDAKICKKVDAYKNIEELLDYVSVDVNNRIFFETEDWKNVGKLFKLPTDGIFADIVLWDQYQCLGENILNNALYTKGIATKPIYQSKFIKLNEFKDKEAKTKFKIQLGTIPEGVENYEVNLVLVQDKHFCRNIMKADSIYVDLNSDNKCRIIGDTITVYNQYKYKPKADTAILKFKVPFALAKSDFNESDIKTFIDALNEPAFNPLHIKITAFSSIEGEEETNIQLRENRAKSIIEALTKNTNGKKIETEIFTSDSWEIFMTDIEKTQFAGFKNKTKDEIRAEIKKQGSNPALEAIFQKHRFALVEMKVVYDISSPKKEQDFVLNKFNKAVAASDLVLALSVQKYIITKVRHNKYSFLTIDNMIIPEDSVRFAGLQMNKLWLDYTARAKEIDTAFWDRVNYLEKLDPKNDYITYNKLFCELNFTVFKSETEIDAIQTKVDALLTKSLPKPIMDALNLQLQIKSLVSLSEELIVTDRQSFIQQKLDRIKTIIDLNENDWKGALNLAQLFTSMKDYEYSINLLKPFVQTKDANEELIFTFISLCTHTDYMSQTELFALALKKAIKLNQQRVCELFNNGRLSFQLLDNPNAKKAYCDVCE